MRFGWFSLLLLGMVSEFAPLLAQAPQNIVAPVSQRPATYGVPPQQTVPPNTPQSGDSYTPTPLADWKVEEAPSFKIDFKNGIGLSSGDGLFSMRINALLQIDYRGFAHTANEIHNANSALHDDFALPRIRLFFRGGATEFVDYAVSVNTGLSPNAQGNVPAPTNLLDAYLDFNPFGAENKEYFQLRVGRFKTPYGYQFYKISPQDFVTPELSMFQTNFLQNWEVGAMVHGELAQKRFEYAAGIFNGVPNSFEVPQDGKQGIFLLAARPFLLREGSFLQNLMIVGSTAVGNQNGPALPNTLGTAAASNGPPDTPMISPTFLVFNGTATQAGFHQLWNVDLVWSYHSLNFYGEYSGGRQTYGLTTAPGARIPVNLSGYSAAVTYFLTGEEISATRARVMPLHPFNWSAGSFGALEAFARYSELTISDNVLTSGLLVAGANANEVGAVDVGMHWYPNEYVRITLDWQHANFNRQTSLAPGVAGAPTSNVQDMLWLRAQLYY